MKSYRELFQYAVYGAACFVASSAAALPFNNDMVDTQAYRAGQIVRSKPAGTVPIGSLGYHVEKKEETLNWSNPRSGDPLSAKFGRRLYQVNCSPCHGMYKAGTRDLGPVGKKLILPPADFTDKFYQDKPDGFFYGTIQFGGAALMPALGWKLSPEEKWDIVSYIRELQAAAGSHVSEKK